MSASREPMWYRILKAQESGTIKRLEDALNWSSVRAQSATLFNIPMEIRSMILKELYIEDKAHSSKFYRPALAICRQMRYEAIDMFFREDVFHFRVDRWGVTQISGPLPVDTFSNCGVHARVFVRHVELDFTLELKDGHPRGNDGQPFSSYIIEYGVEAYYTAHDWNRDANLFSLADIRRLDSLGFWKLRSVKIRLNDLGIFLGPTTVRFARSKSGTSNDFRERLLEALQIFFQNTQIRARNVEILDVDPIAKALLESAIRLEGHHRRAWPMCGENTEDAGRPKSGLKMEAQLERLALVMDDDK
ncbi:hypothetical protein H2201_002965 [Coniosporium apollinis]|uniref:F-box domain-containing protein n=2 Tax=Coniosporium TaxID=2810619 RepID=A0ABQ9P0L9_9PEZI|nr:hypothetical protein H2199_007708 [Cladosporium sp. JES 115]KAJ9666831.1 hypothetical protein H2201_002965 [Coniosporium apollinis]